MKYIYSILFYSILFYCMYVSLNNTYIHYTWAQWYTHSNAFSYVCIHAAHFILAYDWDSLRLALFSSLCIHAFFRTFHDNMILSILVKQGPTINYFVLNTPFGVILVTRVPMLYIRSNPPAHFFQVLCGQFCCCNISIKHLTVSNKLV